MTTVLLMTFLILSWIWYTKKQDDEYDELRALIDDEDDYYLTETTMIVDDEDGDKVYYNQAEILKHKILLIYRFRTEDDVIATKVKYTDNTERVLFIDEDAHDELVEAAEKKEEQWE